MGLLDSELISAFIPVDKYSRFNSLRHNLASQNEKYHNYFKSKSNTIRLFVDTFIEHNKEFMELIDGMEKKK
jgi:hypothetical protein